MEFLECCPKILITETFFVLRVTQLVPVLNPKSNNSFVISPQSKWHCRSQPPPHQIGHGSQLFHNINNGTHSRQTNFYKYQTLIPIFTTICLFPSPTLSLSALSHRPISAVLRPIESSIVSSVGPRGSCYQRSGT